MSIKLRKAWLTTVKTMKLIMSIAPGQHHQINNHSKNLQPLKIKIPKQSKPPKCEKEKPMCKAKSNL